MDMVVVVVMVIQADTCINRLDDGVCLCTNKKSTNKHLISQVVMNQQYKPAESIIYHNVIDQMLLYYFHQQITLFYMPKFNNNNNNNAAITDRRYSHYFVDGVTRRWLRFWREPVYMHY